MIAKWIRCKYLGPSLQHVENQVDIPFDQVLEAFSLAVGHLNHSTRPIQCQTVNSHRPPSIRISDVTSSELSMGSRRVRVGVNWVCVFRIFSTRARRNTRHSSSC